MTTVRQGQSSQALLQQLFDCQCCAKTLGGPSAASSLMTLWDPLHQHALLPCGHDLLGATGEHLLNVDIWPFFVSRPFADPDFPMWPAKPHHSTAMQYLELDLQAAAIIGSKSFYTSAAEYPLHYGQRPGLFHLHGTIICCLSCDSLSVCRKKACSFKDSFSCSAEI